jgi:hypothetical protein
VNSSGRRESYSQHTPWNLNPVGIVLPEDGRKSDCSLNPVHLRETAANFLSLEFSEASMERMRNARSTHGRKNGQSVSRDAMLRASRLSCYVCAPLYVLFGVPDWIDYHDRRMIAVRAVAGMCFVILLAVSYVPIGKRHPYALAFLGFLFGCVGLDVIMMMANDIYAYAEGFGLVTFMFCILIPANFRRLLLACIVFVGLYLVPALMPQLAHGKANTGGMLVLIFGTGAGLVKGWFDDKTKQAATYKKKPTSPYLRAILGLSERHDREARFRGG